MLACAQGLVKAVPVAIVWLCKIRLLAGPLRSIPLDFTQGTFTGSQ